MAQRNNRDAVDSLIRGFGWGAGVATTRVSYSVKRKRDRQDNLGSKVILRRHMDGEHDGGASWVVSWN
jgi:hypothetical protein